MRAANAVTLTMLLIVHAGLCFGEIYTWRDADGRINYSDTPPPTVDAKKVTSSTGSSGGDDAAAARKVAADKEAGFRKRQTEATDAATKTSTEKQQADERQANCIQAKAQLQGLESGQIRFKIGATGERVGLDGDVREAELARARKSVESWCR
jgi:hypothetical protein